ncbi:MAG TPA: hypothetical protein IAB27_06265 [Candidatus Coprosoma intestinipullorum]|uniref:Uncharacterized protein n=1 Tax=Candidatus Coprosoma intestinipullorum TaxID=2840752 RepID=A0A9D0ZRR7_9FIRM|nr:hypothetical protein [Candidatus Coprosoma intestinipullorum]
MTAGQNELRYLRYYYGDDLRDEGILSKALDKVSDVLDKITLLEWTGHFDEAWKLIKELDFDEDKFWSLKKFNFELEKTIDIRVLNKKYSFLDKVLNVITADIDFQQKLISLDDRELNLFKKLMNDVPDKYFLSFAECFLDNMGESPFKDSMVRYDLLNQSLPDNLSDAEREALIFLYNSRVSFDVQSYEELGFLNLPEFWMEKLNQANDLDEIKEVLLSRCGFDLKSACLLIKTYDIKDVNVPSSVLETYNYILKVIESESVSELKELGFEDKGFKNYYLFERRLKEAFLENINQSLEFNGDSFKLLVTVLGAYGKDREIDDYKDLWTRAKISPLMSCSLVSDDNLALAPVKTVILGFKEMNRNLLNMKEQDLNSGVSENDLNQASRIPGNFQSSSSLIDETRSDYNELVFERYDDFKVVMPDYVLWFRDNKKGYEMALKAASDFDIPLIEIDPYKLGEKWSLEISRMVERLNDSNFESLALEIITKFLNNRNGLSLHREVLDEFFSDERFEEIVRDLYEVCPDYLMEILNKEISKMKKCFINQNNLDDAGLLNKVINYQGFKK